MSWLQGRGLLRTGSDHKIGENDVIDDFGAFVRGLHASQPYWAANLTCNHRGKLGWTAETGKQKPNADVDKQSGRSNLMVQIGKRFLDNPFEFSSSVWDPLQFRDDLNPLGASKY